MNEQNEHKVNLLIQSNHLKPADLSKLEGLLRKTQIDHPKPADLRALKRLVEKTPELWSTMSDLTNLSVELILKGAWLSPAVRAMIAAGQADIRLDLGYQDAPALEKMLIDHVIISWLQLQKAQIMYENALSGSTRLPVADYWERRLTVSQARFLRASETLARVRRLARPNALQVNIGARQLNIAQAASKSGEDAGVKEG